MAISIDGENLVITLESGIYNIDVQEDLYEPWKDWVLGSPVNRGYPAAFRLVTSEELSASVLSGAYFFIRNDYGWRIRPAEEDGSWYLTGNLAPQNTGLPILVPTLGGYTTGVFGLQPVTQNVDSIIDTATNLVRNLQYMVESFKPKPAFGQSIYVAPYSGVDSDNNDGTNRTTPLKTFAAAHERALSNNNDAIYIIGDNPSGVTEMDERIVITKNDLHVRGTGQNMHIHTTVANPGDMISVNASGCEVGGFYVETDNTSGNGIYMMGDNNRFANMYFDAVPGDGFNSSDCHFGHLENVTFEFPGGDGISIENCKHLIVRHCHIEQPGSGTGIKIRKNGNGVSDEAEIDDTIIHNVTTGIDIGADCTYMLIRANNRFVGTIGTKVLDNGIGTHIESIWKDKAALTVAKFLGLK